MDCMKQNLNNLKRGITINELIQSINKTDSHSIKSTEITVKEKIECLNTLMAIFGDVLSEETKEDILIAALKDMLGFDLERHPKEQKTCASTKVVEEFAKWMNEPANCHNHRTRIFNGCI